jgi:TPR repeat protein
LLATGGAISAPTVADILAAMKQGNYALALRLARPLAEAGNAEAQAMVGNLYELGLGVAQDHSKALGWFTRAADQGNVTAETALGRMYSKGAGVQMDSVKAYRWFALAAKQGDVDAQCAIGDLYSEGNRVPQDYGEAVKWYRIAAEMNNDAAQAKLGLMYEIGKGVPQDYVQAHMWFNLAASQSSSGVEPFPVATSGIESAFHEAAATARDRVAAKLTPEELAEAQRLAREWSEGRQ